MTIIKYAICWTKSEREERDILSEWIKTIRKSSISSIYHFTGKMRTTYPSVFKKPEDVYRLHRQQNKCMTTRTSDKNEGRNRCHRGLSILFRTVKPAGSLQSKLCIRGYQSSKLVRKNCLTKSINNQISQMQRVLDFSMVTELYFYHEFYRRLSQTVGKILERRT
jgi:hypothetical protein